MGLLRHYGPPRGLLLFSHAFSFAVLAGAFVLIFFPGMAGRWLFWLSGVDTLVHSESMARRFAHYVRAAGFALTGVIILKSAILLWWERVAAPLAFWAYVGLNLCLMVGFHFVGINFFAWFYWFSLLPAAGIVLHVLCLIPRNKSKL
ncbi:MAG: hypothetical protein N2110_08045 [Flavobacteriales bacterium]|nr:hypothetical protein [Flavobacteriales bacterium]MCX7768958.1 hypothetical protein [Flavobacteriales bacterium]MDW8410805.1 hypothetical protein [Flavobacteriales bacterium]